RRPRGALRKERFGLLDLLVDDRRELVERLRADETASVDEEVGRARRLHVVAEGDVVVDRLLERLRLHRGHRLLRIEADLLRDRLEMGVLELGLRIEQRLVRAPEAGLALLLATEARAVR